MGSLKASGRVDTARNARGVPIHFNVTSDHYKRIQALKRAFIRAAKEALLEEAKVIMAKANADVPVSSGALRRSAFVGSFSVYRRRSVSLRFGYRSPYASFVHEGARPGPPVGAHYPLGPKAKWFSHIVWREVPDFRARFAAKVRAGLAGA